MNQPRIKRVLQNMEDAGLEQIIVSSTASVYYLTGLWIEPHERLLALYLHCDGTLTLFGNEIFGIEPPAGLGLVCHPDGANPVKDLAQTVRPGKIGIDKFWPSKFLIGLMELRDGLQPVLGSAPVDLARMTKDDAEQAALRHASQVNDLVVKTAIAALRDGAVESELASLVNRTYLQHGADVSDGMQLVCFGANAADPHHAPGPAVVQAGDCAVFDIFTPISRYWCDMTRTVFFREVSDEARRVYETVVQANLAGIAAVRPGVPLSEIDRTARRVIEDAGYGPYFTHRLGHGIGLECHEPPDVSSATDAIALPGMAFSIEPGIYLPGEVGVRIEDLVLVTPDGCEVLNHATKELQVVG